MFESVGKYRYYNTWLIVICDEELARYYRELIRSYSPSTKVQPSKHGSHITVIAGKYEPHHKNEFWKKYDGNSVIFQYSTEIQTDGTYFWLPVVCKEFENLRIELGLAPIIPIPWHLTIGNLKQSS